MTTVDEVMEILKDGKRHNLSEIAKRLKRTQKQTEEILQFLAKCNFATFDWKNNTVMIDSGLKELILLEEQTTPQPPTKRMTTPERR